MKTKTAPTGNQKKNKAAATAKAKKTTTATRRQIRQPSPFAQGCMSAGDALLIASAYRPLSEEELAAVESAKAEAMERRAAA